MRVLAPAPLSGFLCALVLCLSSACDGPTVYLGQPKSSLNQAPDAAEDRDAQVDEDEDDEAVRCNDDAMCSGKRAYCQPESRVCVRCLVDAHCNPDEFCTPRGKCDDD